MSRGSRRLRHPVCGCCGVPVASRIVGRVTHWRHRLKRDEARCGRPQMVCERERYEADCQAVETDIGALSRMRASA